ncbi:Carbamoyltransferase [Gracilaria domingensis]|nr:Carbamoyltransferase [Gracilaria domingensis]
MIAFITTNLPLFPASRKRQAQQYRRGQAKCVTPPIVIGINQYSHDASVALVDSSSGKLLFAQSKERLTRRKHDGGDVADLVLHAMESVASDDETASDVASHVQLVVANNHHFRILPFETRIPFQTSLGYVPSSYRSPWNLIGSEASYLQGSERYAPAATKIELSHHLAHAYSAVCSCPFNRGVMVVMDGMGDARDDWLVAQSSRDVSHISELSCPGFVRNSTGFREYPRDVDDRPGVSFREAETAYVFEKRRNGVHFARIFKRWTPENAPSELSNHSFEEMDSIGAMYSRVSAIVFKDWNNCGKNNDVLTKTDLFLQGERYFIQGRLYDGSIDMEIGRTNGLENLEKSIADCDNTPEGRKLRSHFEHIAHRIQQDLEQVAFDFISKLMSDTGECNLVLAGGVALNSAMNGILSSIPSVKGFFVPPFPGDEGIAIGCAFFGLSFISQMSGRHVQYCPKTFKPYLGRRYSHEDISQAIDRYRPWIREKRGDSAKEAAAALARGSVVAWFNGRSEFGPRALGSRSILADPRDKNMVYHLNETVKKRESFRPFAPSVLAEYVSHWFENSGSESSPFMSLTQKANMCHLIPAVVHVDGTSRLQTLTQDQNPDFHSLVSHFHAMTNIPMVLNTSFNTAGEPIVESPIDAMKTFLRAEGIDYLIFPGYILSKREEFSFTLGCKISSACCGFRSQQVQNAHGECLLTSITVLGRTLKVDGEASDFHFEEQNVELMDGLQLEILEIVHQLRTCTVSHVLRSISPSLTDACGADFEATDLPSVDDVLLRIDVFR